MIMNILLAVGLSSHPIETMEPLAENCILVAGTNDIHGHLEPHRIYRGETAVEMGGLGAMSAYIASLKRWANGRLALFDGGDAYHGTYESNAAHGRDVIKLMNLMGYHGMALGNHEFDFGASVDAPDDPRGHLKERLSEADFPILSSNIAKLDQSAVQWDNLNAHTTVQIGSMKIGVIGVSTVETVYTTHPRNVVGLQFDDPRERLIRTSESLRRDGADLIVMASHVGGKCSDLSNPKDISSCDTDEELYQLLNGIPKGTIDIAIGGHTHQVLAHYFNDVATIESGSYARNISLVKACKTPERVETTVLPPLPLCLTTFSDGTCSPNGTESAVRTRYFFGEPLTTPSEVQEVISDALLRASKLSKRQMGINLITPLERLPHHDSPLGKTIAAAILRSSDADIAIQNRGGVRSDLPRGSINHRQLYTVLPFANRITMLEMPASDLMTMLEHMAKRRSDLLPYLAGLEVIRVDGLLQIRDGDEIIAPDRVLTVAVNDYIAAGGENLGEFFQQRPFIKQRETAVLLFDSVAGYLRDLSPDSLTQLEP